MKKAESAESAESKVKKADIFFKGFRMSYLVLGVMSIAEMIGVEVNIVTFSFIFFMLTFPVDVLIDNIYLARKAEKDFYSKKRKGVK